MRVGKATRFTVGGRPAGQGILWSRINAKDETVEVGEERLTMEKLKKRFEPCDK